MIRPASRPALAAAAVLAASCSSTLPDLQDLEEAARREPGEVRRQDLARTPASPADAMTTIARLEDARDDGGGLLQILVGMFTPEVRARAALALGRLPRERFRASVTQALAAALDDPVADVRAAAAFSLGLRGDPVAADALLAGWLDPEPEVRAAVVAAAGRLDDPRLRARVVEAMASPLEAVRIEAVLAPHAWPASGPEADAVDGALAEAASRVVRGSEAARAFPAAADGALESPEVVWRALFSLQRRGADLGRDAYHARAADPHPLARLFAVKGLAGLEAHEAGRVALEAAADDEDWRVAVEAVRGLGRYGDRRSLDALEEALAHPTTHVRRTAAEALGAFAVDRARVATLLEGARVDPSPSVRAAVLVAEARFRGARAIPLVEEAARAEDPVLRIAAAEAAAELSTDLAVPLLVAASRDADLRVAGAAAAGLGEHDAEAAHARLVELAEDGDNGLRLAAVIALREHPRPDDLAVLERAYRSAEGDVAPEVRVQALRSAAATGADGLVELLREAARDPHPYVRRAAAAEHREKTGEDPPWSSGNAPAREPLEAAAPLSADELGGDGARPVVEVVTTRGTMLFELFLDEAPVHVHNFLELARRDHYDGLTFHRVVPDFVVQGGCYRGDGNGSGTWRGAADELRHELTPRKYVRGSLGMPRNEDLDSGGSQFFVTHRPTPHLDARYTIFGELRAGGEVLDAIEVGDVILDVRRR